MDWSSIGGWLKSNAGTGVSLVGSLLTGNIPGAVASGIALVSSATGTDNPVEAMKILQTDPAAMIKLKELAIQDEENIRNHIRSMAEMQLKDKQAEHKETQETTRSGDNAEDIVVRRTRPLQSWLSLIIAIIYAILARSYGDIKDTDIYVIGLFLTLPWTYAGLRQVGKGIDSFRKTGVYKQDS